MNKKQKTILKLFESCRESGVFEFDNDKVKEICQETGFKNPFDTTKVDQSELLPDDVRNAGYCIVHLGKGKHCFSPALDVWFHQFEPIEPEEEKDWDYKPSLLNHTDASESNVISMAYNQKIIQDFLYNDISVTPKIYMSRRTKITESYHVGAEYIQVEELQVEMDATFENNGIVTVFEGKNGNPDDFSVYQLFHPFLDYRKVKGVKDIDCCYLIKPNNKKGPITISLYLYDFEDPKNIGSIRLKKKARYNLKAR